MDNVVQLEFYGLAIALTSRDAAVVEHIRRDFSYFAGVEEEPAIRIEVRDADPPFAELPDLRAAFQTPRNVCYTDGERTYIDYFGKALSIHDRRAGTYRVFSRSGSLRHEICYQFILSVVGGHLDSRGMHRLHALGISRGGRAILVLLPMGGGKSTLALELLKGGSVELLSEDSPLITRRGEVLPFPLRIGVKRGNEPDVPKKFMRRIERMEFDPKVLIDIDCFRDHLSAPAKPALILLGQRALGTQSCIEPVSKQAAAKAFFSNAVVGLGIYQGLEYLLERSGWELAGKLGLAWSRSRASLAVISRAKAFRFVMGRDIGKNRNTLLDFIDRELRA